MRKGATYAIVAGLALAISRLPFLSAGYGANADAWRVARVARNIAETKIYEVSRTPGYPLHEIVCASVWRGGPWALNSLSAIFGLAAAIAVWQIARRLRCRDSLLLATAFAFTPIIFISSVTSKDYIWALALSLWAVFAALDRRPILAGLLLGLSIGCRITSGAMIAPIAMIILGYGSMRLMFRFVIVTLLVGALMFLPVWLRYGIHFFTFSENHTRPPIQTVLERGSFEVWGTVGVLGLLLAVLLAPIARKWSGSSIPAINNALVTPALFVTLLLYLVAYLRLPDQAGYLCPAVAPILFLLARFVPRPLFQIACLSLLLSWWKPVMADHRERVAILRDVNGFVAATENALPGENTIIVGGWEPLIAVLYPKTHNNYIYLLSPDLAENLIAQRHSIAYSCEIVRVFNYRVTGLDLAAIGARNVRMMLVGTP